MKDVKDLLMDALVELYQDGPFSESYGLCSHVHEYLVGMHFCPQGPIADAVDDLMEELFRRWPEYSGSVDYPVPGPEGQSPSLAFRLLKMWTGEYGAKRWALAEFMLRTLAHGAA